MRNEIKMDDFFEASRESRQGGRPENQDHCAESLIACDNALFSVCDGMGGAVGGKTASLIAADTIVEVVKQGLENETDIAEKRYVEVLEKAIQEANERVYTRSRSDIHLYGMGTTTVTLLLTPMAAFVAHVGDSRCYKLHKGKKVFRTFDHSRVFELVKLGYMTEEQARTANGSNIISRALGVAKKVEVEIEKMDYRKGDRFILCCDGIWNTMPEQELVPLFNQEPDNAKASALVAQTIDELGTQSGVEYDNLSIIVVDVKKDSLWRSNVLKIAAKKLWHSFPKNDNHNKIRR